MKDEWKIKYSLLLGLAILFLKGIPPPKIIFFKENGMTVIKPNFKKRNFHAFSQLSYARKITVENLRFFSLRNHNCAILKCFY